MKNILVISASPRKGGNSDVLCDEFIKGAQQAGHKVEKIFLRNFKVNYCTKSAAFATALTSACRKTIWRR
ncbi:flavodoxin family protein [Ruminococcus sp.]|uniref:flavodoxin family protein n=1 Tax=Ruminococcus sp. TaxID=41978 RepID=UPI00399F7201